MEDMNNRIKEFLERKDNIIRLKTATHLRRPALQALDILLIDEFGDELKTYDRDQLADWKRVVGRITKDILEPMGYEVEKRGVKIKDLPLFLTASRYKKI